MAPFLREWSMGLRRRFRFSCPPRQYSRAFRARELNAEVDRLPLWKPDLLISALGRNGLDSCNIAKATHPSLNADCRLTGSPSPHPHRLPLPPRASCILPHGRSAGPGSARSTPLRGTPRRLKNESYCFDCKGLALIRTRIPRHRAVSG